MKKRILALLMILSVTASASTITTPDMNLVLPVPGSEMGPIWAQRLNTAFGLIDSHDHSSGKGTQVPSAGININADLQIGDFNLVNPRSTMYTSQSSPLSTSADKNNVYVVNGDLYYNNSSGIPVQVTAGTAVNTGGTGNITGMGGTTAALTYSNSTKTFSFTQSAGVTADVGLGRLSLFEDAVSTNSVTLRSPTSLSSSYTWVLPTSLPPGSPTFLTVDSTGHMANQYTVDSSTIELGTSTIRVKDQGITTAKIADGSVTSAKRAALNYAQSSNSGRVDVTSVSTWTDVVSVSITTTGRPVQLGLGTGTLYALLSSIGSPASGTALFRIVRDSSIVVTQGVVDVAMDDANGLVGVPAGSLNTFDSTSSGAHTYKLQASISASFVTARVESVFLYAYEL